MNADETSSEFPGWITDLGITDLSTGRAAARGSRERLLEAGRFVLGNASDYSTAHLVFSGLLARAQGLHEGAVAATDADNPYVAFTVLRAYAETAAAVLFVKDHPAELKKFWNDTDGRGVKIGRIINYAETRLKGFKDIYADMSGYAHPHAKSVLASTQNTEGRTVRWHSAPTFKFQRERVLAYAWATELAGACAHLLVEMARAFRLAAIDPGAVEVTESESSRD